MQNYVCQLQAIQKNGRLLVVSSFLITLVYVAETFAAGTAADPVATVRNADVVILLYGLPVCEKATFVADPFFNSSHKGKKTILREP